MVFYDKKIRNRFIKTLCLFSLILLNGYISENQIGRRMKRICL